MLVDEASLVNCSPPRLAKASAASTAQSSSSSSSIVLLVLESLDEDVLELEALVGAWSSAGLPSRFRWS